jgi:hypothetical protein
MLPPEVNPGSRRCTPSSAPNLLAPDDSLNQLCLFVHCQRLKTQGTSEAMNRQLDELRLRRPAGDCIAAGPVPGRFEKISS